MLDMESLAHLNLNEEQLEELQQMAEQEQAQE
jgi:hypothetical protein